MAITEARVAPVEVARARARVLVVDDHSLLRRGVANIINQEADLEVVAEAANGRDGVEAFRAHRPDVTLMDLRMPEMNGLDAMVAIRNEFPDAKIIVLTTYESDVQDAMKLGARAYLLKTHLDKELLPTIRAVQGGK